MASPAQAMGSAPKFRPGSAAFLLLLACGSPPHAPAPPAVATQAAANIPDEFANVPWSTVELAKVPARISLPDARAWHAKQSGSFIVLEHAGSGSSLVLRVWRAARLVRPAECEAEARLLRPALPVVDAVSRIEERRLTAPAGFDVRLVVLAEPGPAASVRGSALAVGAGVGVCYLASFETQADGPLAAERVADRLDAVVRGCFETVELESAERRVPPPPGVE